MLSAGKLTAGLAENNGSLPLGLSVRPTYGLTAPIETGISSGPNVQPHIEYGTTFILLYRELS